MNYNAIKWNQLRIWRNINGSGRIIYENEPALECGDTVTYIEGEVHHFSVERLEEHLKGTYDVSVLKIDDKTTKLHIVRLK